MWRGSQLSWKQDSSKRCHLFASYVRALGGELEFYARFKKRGDKARLVRIKNKTKEEHHSV